MSDGYNTLTELTVSMGRGKVLYQWTPEPVGDDPNHCDIPGEYAVIELPGRADRVMICGTYRGQWHCNAAARLLVAHLLDALAAAEERERGVREAIENRLRQDRSSRFAGCVDCDHPGKCSREAGCMMVPPCPILSAALATTENKQ